MSDQSAPPPAPRGEASAFLVSDEIVGASVRRAPKYAVFLTLGAALGLLVAMILTFAFNGSSEVSPNTGVQYSQVQVFGFLALICVGLGLILSAGVALFFDRRSTRSTRQVTVDHETVEEID